MAPRTPALPTDSPAHNAPRTDSPNNTSPDQREQPAKNHKENEPSQEEDHKEKATLSPTAPLQTRTNLPIRQQQQQQQQQQPSTSKTKTPTSSYSHSANTRTPNPDLQTPDLAEQPAATNPPAPPPTTTSLLAQIAQTFTTYTTFRTTHLARIQTARAQNAVNLRLLAAISARLESHVERQEQGLLSAAESAEVTGLVAQFCEMVEIVEEQAGLTAGLEGMVGGVGVGDVWEGVRRRGGGGEE